MRPYREIKKDVDGVLAEIPEIIGITHCNTHWVPYLNGNGTVVDVAIVVHPDLKVGDAHSVAKKARKCVMQHGTFYVSINLYCADAHACFSCRAIEAIPYIAEADIHLELLDNDNDEEIA